MSPTIDLHRLPQIDLLLHQRHLLLFHVHQQHRCHLNEMESSLLNRTEQMQTSSSMPNNMCRHFAATMELTMQFISLYLRLLQGGMVAIMHSPLLKVTILEATGNMLLDVSCHYFLLVKVR